MKRFGILICCLFFFMFLPTHIFAQSEHMEASIVLIQNRDVRVQILSDALKGREFPVALFDPKQIGNQQLRVGDKVIVTLLSNAGDKQKVIIVDHVRRTPLFTLFLIFLSIVILVGRKKGVLSIVAMLISFLIIGRFILPQILAGNDPVIISLLGALFIIPSLFYISHGFSTKTTIAVVSTFLTLIVTGVLAVTFVYFTKLTGFAAEEATFIQATGQNIDIRSLLLAGIIIGAMGVLDDITISQTSIVEKLIRANPKFGGRELFSEAMDVGRDHIASLVNTLILVYVGAALPLFVLFYSSDFVYSEVVNMELVATEIVRTLVSSIGIVLAVPLTTAIAAFHMQKLKTK